MAIKVLPQRRIYSKFIQLNTFSVKQFVHKAHKIKSIEVFFYVKVFNFFSIKCTYKMKYIK